jgi:hypothetical protein
MRTIFIVSAAVAGLALTACGTTTTTLHPTHTAAAPVAAAASSAPAPPPSWCTASFARAVKGSTPAALEPWLRDSAVIRDLFRQWSFVLAENGLIDHPHSIAWLGNNAPVTTGGLEQADQDISKINRICSAEG